MLSMRLLLGFFFVFVPVVGAQSRATDAGLSQLQGRIWKVTQAASQPAAGSIYIFLPNGTLLQTSCVETYRISTWSPDKSGPGVIRVVEDGQPAFTAKIAEATPKKLRLEQTLIRSKEKQSLTLEAVEREFVCPDLRK
jgi:hypothetical protein